MENQRKEKCLVFSLGVKETIEDKYITEKLDLLLCINLQ